MERHQHSRDAGQVFRFKSSSEHFINCYIQICRMHKSLVIQLQPQVVSNRNYKSYVFQKVVQKPSIDFSSQLGKTKIVQSVSYAKDPSPLPTTEKGKNLFSNITSLLVLLLVGIGKCAKTLNNYVKRIFQWFWQSCSCMIIFELLVLTLVLGVTVGYLNESVWVQDYMMMKLYAKMWNGKQSIDIMALIENSQ